MEFTIFLERLGDVDVQAEVEFERDRNYGADADGNRGEDVMLLKFINFLAFDENGVALLLTYEERDKIRKYIELHAQPEEGEI